MSDEPTPHKHAPAILGLILAALAVAGMGLWGRNAWDNAHDHDERDRRTTELAHSLSCAVSHDAPGCDG